MDGQKREAEPGSRAKEGLKPQPGGRKDGKSWDAGGREWEEGSQEFGKVGAGDTE